MHTVTAAKLGDGDKTWAVLIDGEAIADGLSEAVAKYHVALLTANVRGHVVRNDHDAFDFGIHDDPEQQP